MAVKTGPLTKAEFAKIWKSALDSGYTQPLSDAGLGGGYEAWDQAFDQLVPLSTEVDVETQGLYINPHSSQTASPATGAVQATVALTFTRTLAAQTSLTIIAGQFIDELQIGPSTTGGTGVLTGRRYSVPEFTFAPGESTKTVTATAERPGLGGNYPLPGSITYFEQVGQNRSSSGANVISSGGRYWLQVAAVSDTVIPLNVGSYVIITGGSLPAAGVRAYASGYLPPNTSVPDGGRLQLIEPITLEFQGLTGTFQDGETVNQGTSSGICKHFYTNAGSGKNYMVIFPASISDTFTIGANIVGVTSGAVASTATLAVFVESQQLSAQSNVSWSIQDTVNTYGLSANNASSPTGGRMAQLDALGANHKLPRGPAENDTLYRQRLAKVPDSVSPQAIRRTANRFLTAANYAGCTLREPGLSTWATFYADRDAADYDKYARSLADYWKTLMSYSEFRGFFDIELPVMRDGEFGIPYDDMSAAANINAYDVPSAYAFHDGYGLTAAQRRQSIWQAVNQARAAGVAFDLSETPSDPFLPNSIAGLLTWYRSDQLIGLDAIGGNVAYWGDLSGNGHTAYQATATARPSLHTSLVEALPYLYLSNVSADGMGLVTPLSSNTGGGTYSVVFTPTSTAGYVISAANGQTAQFVDCYPNSMQVTWLNTHGVAYSNDLATVDVPALNLPVILTLTQQDGANATLYLNGTMVNSWVPDHTVGNTASGQLANLMSFAGFGMAGHMFEVIAYDHKLEADDVTRLHTYLQNRYSVSSTIPFNPKMVSGCVAWYRADMGVTLSGSNVTNWADQSQTGDGANKAAAQANTARSPTVNNSDAAYNYRTTLNFVAANTQYLQSAAWATPISQPSTVFVVGNTSANAINQYFVDGHIENEQAVENFGGTAFAGMYAGTTGLSTGAVSAAPRVIAAVFNGASSQLYVNANTVAASGQAGSNGRTGITIGADFAASVPLNGRIAEIIIYSRALSSSEIAQVFQYLGTRYAIAIGP